MKSRFSLRATARLREASPVTDDIQEITGSNPVGTATMNEQAEGKDRLIKRVSIIGAVLLLLGFLGYQLYLAKADSQTTDEGVHLSAGLTYLKTNDYRFNPEHPTLTKKLAALPLLFININKPVNAQILWDKAGNFFYDSWPENRQYADKLMYESGNNADLIVFLSRLGPILLAVLLGLAIYALSVHFWGYLGGLLSLGLFVLDPTITAHSHLVTTDVAASLGLLLMLGTFYFFMKYRDWKRTIFLGLGIGIAMLSKFTLVIGLVELAILYLGYLILHRDNWVNVLKTTVGKGLVALIIAWGVIWAGYGFSIALAPKTSSIASSIKGSYEVDNSDFSPETERLADKTYSVARYFLLPRDYFKGLSLVFNHVENGHSSFLLGQTSNTGWWYYFPVLFLVKTPIITLLLFALACCLAIKDKKSRKIALYLSLGSFAFLLLAMQSKANLGLRHILPVYPPLFILAGYLATSLSKKGGATLGILLVLAIVEFCRIQPFDMGYYNQLVGGSSNGYKIASDSNLDWGQDNKRIKSYIDKNNLADVTVVYNWSGWKALEYRGINYGDLESFLENKHGTFIINASALTDSKYDFLKNRAPDDYVSPGVLVYRFN